LVKPVTAIGEVVSVLLPDVPPLLEVHDAEYDVIGLPLSAGTPKLTDAEPSPLVAVPIAGAFGTPAGTTGSDEGDCAPVPTALVAETRHRYVFPLVRPVTVMGHAAPDFVAAVPPSGDVHEAAYEMMALPLSAGAVNVTTIWWFPRLTDGCAGAAGTAAGMTPADAGDGEPAPTSLVAVTVQV
jgi:hypothetical protein